MLAESRVPRELGPTTASQAPPHHLGEAGVLEAEPMAELMATLELMEWGDRVGRGNMAEVAEVVEVEVVPQHQHMPEELGDRAVLASSSSSTDKEE